MKLKRDKKEHNNNDARKGNQSQEEDSQPNTQHRYVQTWIPKDIISQISAKGRSHLVWITARREESKAYQE